MRLDFEALTLAGPFGTTEENACTDMLTVTVGFYIIYFLNIYLELNVYFSF